MAQSCLDKQRKQPSSSKCKMTVVSKATTKGCKNLDLKKLSLDHPVLTDNEPPRKQPRRSEHPVHLPSAEIFEDFRSANTWICKNSACKAVLSSEDTFCKRCSCCICHLFDDNKDPSLWLVCTSESGDRDCCGLSCHIECALQCQKAGVFSLGQFMLLDGSYCCASCGKVSGIIGCWKRQLAVAKDARRVDVLCYRIFLSYRLLDGTSRFKELHQTVEEAKAKLETEVGPVDGVSAKMARGIVSRLSIAADVQKLCFAAIEKADEWLRLRSTGHLEENHKDSLPAACRFHFEEISSSSLVIVLKEASSTFDAIKGYKFWYCKTRDQPYKKEPVIFPRAQRRILITNLQPCTEYAFRIISFTEDGDFGHSESKCFTKSVEIINKHMENNGAEGCSSSDKQEGKTPVARSSGFKVRNLGKILRLAWAQEDGCYDGFDDDNVQEESCGGSGEVIAEVVEAAPATSRRLDLNVATVPDLNAEATPPTDCSPEEENACSSEKNELARSNGSDDSQTCAATLVHEVPAVESRPECEKQPAEETCEGDSTLVSGSPRRFQHRLGQLDDNYEYCVKVVRWLECLGHIKSDFRMKFLTWFSLRSTEQERRVVLTFIHTLIEEPSSLAGQLLDSFSEIVTCKRLRSGFCSKLWH
ncbi:Fibronectin type III domain containing protein [Musa troglodytarum]|uniref:Fibronectin type III domain containing protein n=1 Tax=Musa troglodytarum TaxID=320322 RepID=A0A9E7FFW2_9LILI|nr:Fibronectin type III domain containing protein [Musa troglodytarum]